MKITVHYTGQIKAALGKGCETLETESPTSLDELIHRIAHRDGKSTRALFLDDNDLVQRSLVLIVNDEQVTLDGNPQLKSGDEVTILSPISGG